jgi:Epoxide hydrolase N terminus
MAAVPFTIDIPEASLTDLKERLSRTRWPGEITDSGCQARAFRPAGGRLGVAAQTLLPGIVRLKV